MCIKCDELMVGDWVIDKRNILRHIIAVGKNYALSIFEDKEARICFNDENVELLPIPLTKEILEKNGWEAHTHFLPTLYEESYLVKNNGNIHIEWKEGFLRVWFDFNPNDCVYADMFMPCKYVHKLQQALRLIELKDEANNFKI